jgi:hypothetical protein
MKRYTSKKIQIRQSKRHAFDAPVEIRWFDSERQAHSVLGKSFDVSIYGLGILVPFQLPPDQQLTVTLNGVEVCGGAVMRHSQPCGSGFKIGLYFRLSLLMQNVPGVDQLLERSLFSRSPGPAAIVTSLVRRFVLRFWRFASAKANNPLACIESFRGQPVGKQINEHVLIRDTK